MARSTIGLDIGTSAVRAAEIKGADPQVLARFAQLALPFGAMAGGEVADPEAVANTIRDLWRRGEFKAKQVAVAVANQNVVVRQVDVPAMDPSDLRGALRYQVADYIPMPIEEAMLDFIVLEEFTTEDGAAMMRLLTVAALKEMVNRVVDVVERAGLEPVAIDLTPLATVRALVDPVPPVVGEVEAQAVVDVGAGVTGIVVHVQGTPRFVRLLPAGGNDITSALMNDMSLSFEDAEAQKAAIGLQPEGAAVPSGAARLIEERAAVFIDDVRRSLEYYQSQADAVRIADVQMTGGGSRLPHLTERLASALGIPVMPGRALTRVHLGDLGLNDEQIEQVQSVAAVAVGLAVDE